MEVRANNVSRRFSGTIALHDVTLTIPSGRRVALIGPNGSGKSTLTRIMMGMLHYQGTVTIDGRDPSQYRALLAKRLAYVSQNPPQLQSTVAEIVRTVARLRERPEDVFVKAASRLDLDLLRVADRPLRGLSVGMKQKFLIALALAAEPDLLILDEPTASLDPLARSRFYEYFNEVAGQATLILCSHRLEEIQHLVDDVILLEGGRIQFDGPVGEFLKERAQSVVEVTLANDVDTAWLEESGFLRSSNHSWVITVQIGEKMSVTRRILKRFEGTLTNINVRDMETVTIHPPRGKQ